MTKSKPTPDLPLERILRKRDLPQYVGLRRSAIDLLIKRGLFPAGFYLNDARNVRGWTLSEVQEWQARWIRDRRLKTRVDAAARAAMVHDALENDRELPSWINQTR